MMPSILDKIDTKLSGILDKYNHVLSSVFDRMDIP